MALRSVALPPLNPYAEKAGYRFTAGSGSLEGVLRRGSENVRVDTELVLDDLDVEALDADDFSARFGMSLDMALALLRDASGRIRLPVGLESQRDALRTQLTPILVATLRQALIGATMLPLKTLRGAAGIITRNGRIAVTPLALEPGAATPQQSADTEGAIEALAQLLAARPSLGLTLHGRVGPADEPALAARSLAERLRAGGDLPTISDVGFRSRRRIARALREHGATTAATLDGDDAKVLARYLEVTPVREEQRQELAAARAQALHDALVQRHDVEATRVRMGGHLTGEPGVVPELVAASALAPEAPAGVGAAPSPPS